MLRFLERKLHTRKGDFFRKCRKISHLFKIFVENCKFYLKMTRNVVILIWASQKSSSFFHQKRRIYASKSGHASKSGILSQLQYRRIHSRYDKVNYMDIMGLYRPILAYNMSFMIKYRQYDKRARSNRLQIIILRLIANLFKIF